MIRCCECKICCGVFFWSGLWLFRRVRGGGLGDRLGGWGGLWVERNGQGKEGEKLFFWNSSMNRRLDICSYVSFCIFVLRAHRVLVFFLLDEKEMNGVGEWSKGGW